METVQGGVPPHAVKETLVVNGKWYDISYYILQWTGHKENNGKLPWSDMPLAFSDRQYFAPRSMRYQHSEQVT